MFNDKYIIGSKHGRGDPKKKCVITFIMWNAYENVQVISK